MRQLPSGKRTFALPAACKPRDPLAGLDLSKFTKTVRQHAPKAGACMYGLPCSMSLPTPSLATATIDDGGDRRRQHWGHRLRAASVCPRRDPESSKRRRRRLHGMGQAICLRRVAGFGHWAWSRHTRETDVTNADTGAQGCHRCAVGCSRNSHVPLAPHGGQHSSDGAGGCGLRLGCIAHGGLAVCPWHSVVECSVGSSRRVVMHRAYKNFERKWSSSDSCCKAGCMNA